jgi:hypothetical protein
VSKSRKQTKERKNRALKVRGVKKARAQTEKAVAMPLCFRACANPCARALLPPRTCTHARRWRRGETTRVTVGRSRAAIAPCSWRAAALRVRARRKRWTHTRTAAGAPSPRHAADAPLPTAQTKAGDKKDKK